MSGKRWTNARLGFAWFSLLGGSLVVLFWALYFTEVVDLGQQDPLVRAFESAFPIADALFAGLLFTAGVLLLNGNGSGPLFLAGAGSVSVYLGIIDVTIYGRHGLYHPLDGSGAIEVTVNALCIVGGALSLVYGVLAHRDRLEKIDGRQVENVSENFNPIRVASTNDQERRRGNRLRMVTPRSAGLPLGQVGHSASEWTARSHKLAHALGLGGTPMNAMPVGPGQAVASPPTGKAAITAAHRAKERPAAVTSREFVRGYLVTMRPYLLFVSGITGLAGLSLAPSLPLWRTLALGLAFFLSYGFGQALTDCFQTDTDSLSAPYRPLVRRQIRRQDVMGVSLVGLAAIGLLLAVHNRWNVGLAAAAVAGLATYTHFKRKWWGGPFYNAWIVAVLFLIGYASGVGAVGAAGSWSPALAGTLLAVFFGYANFVLTGYYKDVSADEATGYRTLPVEFGPHTSAIVSDVFSLLMALGSGLAIYDALRSVNPEPATYLALALLGCGFGTAFVAQWRLHNVTHEREAHRAIALVVHAYILILSAIAASQKPDWALPLVLFYVGFLGTMSRRPMQQQI